MKTILFFAIALISTHAWSYEVSYTESEFQRVRLVCNQDGENKFFITDGRAYFNCDRWGECSFFEPFQADLMRNLSDRHMYFNVERETDDFFTIRATGEWDGYMHIDYPNKMEIRVTPRADGRHDFDLMLKSDYADSRKAVYHWVCDRLVQRL